MKMLSFWFLKEVLITNLLLIIVLTDTMATFNQMLFSTLHVPENEIDDAPESVESSGIDILFLGMF